MAVAVAWLMTATALTGLAAALVSARIGAPPFAGEWRIVGPWRAAPAIVVAAVVAITTRMAAVTRAPWRGLLVGSMLAALAWAATLALVDGPSGLLGSLGGRYDYLAALPDAVSAGSFLERFVPEHTGWPTHVQSHPPGMVLLLIGLDTVGLAHAGVVAAIVLVCGAAAVPAALVAVRDAAGEPTARRAAPMLVLVPAAIWWSSADALFAGVAAWAVALAVLATGRRGRASWLMAVAAGGLGAATLLLSYGLVLLAAVPLAVAAWRRRLAPLNATVIVLAIVYIGLRATGFDWWAGFEAARAAYDRGASGDRPYVLFVVANLVVFAVAVGPAAVAGLHRLLRARRFTPVLLLAGAAAAAVLGADVSGLSKGEVERIWLPFVPWVAVGAAALARPRPWLVANGVTAVTLALLLEARW
ncbi:MAG: hypothetical protein ACRD0A_16375 [Acidimicrobiales bacterium]